MVTVSFVVPALRNDGLINPAWLVSRLLGALTDALGEVKVQEGQGFWMIEGELTKAPVLMVTIRIPAEAADDFINEIAGILKRDFGQDEVWVEINGIPELR